MKKRFALLGLLAFLLSALCGCGEKASLSPQEIWEKGRGKSEEEFFSALSFDPERDARRQEMPGAAPGRARYLADWSVEFGGETVAQTELEYTDGKFCYIHYIFDFREDSGKTLRDAYEFVERQRETLRELYGPSCYEELFSTRQGWWGEETWSYENLKASVKRQTYHGYGDALPLPDGDFVLLGLSADDTGYRAVHLTYQPPWPEAVPLSPAP